MNASKSEDPVAAIVRKGAWSASDARILLDAVAASGESVTSFCRAHSLTPERLYNWRRKLAGRVGPEPAKSTRFVALELVGSRSPSSPPSAGPNGSLVLELRSGHRVHVPADFDSSALVRLVETLEQGSPC